MFGIHKHSYAKKYINTELGFDKKENKFVGILVETESMYCRRCDRETTKRRVIS